MFISGHAQKIVRHAKQIGGSQFRQGDDAAALHVLMQWRMGFIGQHVAGQVLGSQANGLQQIIFPGACRLVRQTKDEIQADVGETCVHTRPHGRQGLVRAVPTA